MIVFLLINERYICFCFSYKHSVSLLLLGHALWVIVEDDIVRHLRRGRLGTFDWKHVQE